MIDARREQVHRVAGRARGTISARIRRLYETLETTQINTIDEHQKDPGAEQIKHIEFLLYQDHV